MQIDELVDMYSDLVFSICLKITGNYFDAQDLTQETFLSAFKTPNFDGAYPKAWLCKIATNKCLDYLKRAERRSIPTEEEYFLTLSCEERGTEEIAIEHSVRDQLKAACEGLKPPYNEIALEHFYYEKEARVIAQERNSNIKTIQTQIFRAKGMLKKIWKPFEKGAIEDDNGKAL